VFIVVVSLSTQSGNFWIHPRTSISILTHEEEWSIRSCSYSNQKLVFKTVWGDYVQSPYA